ncbi:hypothetical protein NDU88_004594 [Pleurodeles waltl]|uniref:ribonuclease H n=1 Tax=Pleurodeles waltl TaxID=8319 RepID=A0AAV7WSB6_PLEWA|nr:hypothetical protein NDU88_004594 [Pleurodeles waltl]
MNHLVFIFVEGLRPEISQMIKNHLICWQAKPIDEVLQYAKYCSDEIELKQRKLKEKVMVMQIKAAQAGMQGNGVQQMIQQQPQGNCMFQAQPRGRGRGFVNRGPDLNTVVVQNDVQGMKKISPYYAGIEVQTNSDDEGDDGQFTDLETESTNEEYPLITLFPMLTVTDLPPELQRTVTEKVWDLTGKEVGLIKGVEPVKVQVKPNAVFPQVPQYHMAQDVLIQVSQIIADFVKQGVLKEVMSSLCNSPIMCLKKPCGKVRIVQDLRKINKIVVKCCPIVPNPAVIMFQVPCDAEWFTVVESLELPFSSTLVQYIDDLLIASRTKDDCRYDTIALLNHLGKNGHNVSPKKLQYCQREVKYLGHLIERGFRRISKERVTAILQMNPPTTKRDVRMFLGMVGYCRQWIPNLSIISKPLIKLTGKEVKDDLSTIILSEEELEAYMELRECMCWAPALGMPDYTKPFLLFCHERDVCSLSVLTQVHGGGNRPVAYFSATLDPVAAALLGCLRAVAAVGQSLTQYEGIVMGHSLTVMLPHSVEVLLTRTKTQHMTYARLTREQWELLPETEKETCLNFALRVVDTLDELGSLEGRASREEKRSWQRMQCVQKADD